MTARAPGSGEEFEVDGLKLRLASDFEFQFAAIGVVTVVTADPAETFVANLFSFNTPSGPHVYSNYLFAATFGRSGLDRNGHKNRAALSREVRKRLGQ